MSGETLFVLPTFRDSMSPTLKSALDRRRRASLAGRCDCRARLGIVDLDRHRAEIAHEADCPTGDTLLAPLLRAGGYVA